MCERCFSCLASPEPGRVVRVSIASGELWWALREGGHGVRIVCHSEVPVVVGGQRLTSGRHRNPDPLHELDQSREVAAIHPSCDCGSNNSRVAQRIRQTLRSC